MTYLVKLTVGQVKRFSAIGRSITLAGDGFPTCRSGSPEPLVGILMGYDVFCANCCEVDKNDGDMLLTLLRGRITVAEVKESSRRLRRAGNATFVGRKLNHRDGVVCRCLRAALIGEK